MQRNQNRMEVSIMKRMMSLLMLMIMLCASAIAETQPESSERMMEWFAAQNYQAVWESMTPQMQNSISVDQLTAIVLQSGDFRDYSLLDANEVQGYRIYAYYVCQNNEYIYQLTIDQSGKLAGFYIQPYTAPVKTDDTIHTETIQLRAGEADETTAILTLPEGDGPFPAVILVQGSGPSDLNESAYGIYPFRDLAEGLAQSGIASIRYDKYTYAHPELCTTPDFTVRTEFIIDADAALSALEADSRINSVFLAGHSQGGMLMPRIISELGAERFHGGISISGTPLHLWQIIYRQNMDLLSGMSETDRAVYAPAIEAESDRVHALQALSVNELPEETIFGLPAYYLWDECQTDAAECVIKNDIPVLFVQGEYDWQVTMNEGLEAWKELIPQASFVMIPSATHLLTKIDETTGTQADYRAGDHVCQEVIDVLASWIFEQTD